MSGPRRDSTAAAESSFAGAERRVVSDRAYLVVCHPGPRRVLAVPRPKGTIVGRAGEEAHVALDDGRASRAHAELTHTVDGWVVSDLGSRNGTKVDGQRVEPGHKVRLASGALLRVGDTLLVFREGAAPLVRDDALLPGLSPGIQRARAALEAAALEGGHVLVLGETGVGKEYAARYFHAALGPDRPWVPVNAAEIKGELARPELFGNVEDAWTRAPAREGLVTRASGGVLFLDEIGDLRAAVQAELLRFLEDGTYYVVGDDRGLVTSTARIVAATNVDLELAIQRGEFRRDLLGRLRASNPPVVLPPLRERREDLLDWIPRLVSKPLRWSAGFAETLLVHDWLRNLRELREVVHGAARAAAGDELRREHLDLHMFSTPAAQPDPPVPPPPRGGTPRADWSRAELEGALDAHGGNMKRTAEALGIERTRFYRLCKELGIEPDRLRRRGEE
ncbi:sigma 54-interacting transcriptional regulator [Myxococcota bacterium]|nr:sigma 54-interacting transcriptional regulator [Myxococcota bacterium]